MFFPRRGPYAGAILRFTVTFMPAPEIHLQTRVFHPLVDSTTGRVYLSGWDGEVVSLLLEELRTAFESSDKLDSLTEGEVMDKEAWKSWNGRREGTGMWNERVAKCVDASTAAVAAGKGEDEAILLRSDVGDVEKKIVDRVHVIEQRRAWALNRSRPFFCAPLRIEL